MLVLLCILFFGIGVFPRFNAICSVVLFIFMLGGLYLRLADVFLLGLTCGLMLLLSRIGAIANLWPLPTALALSIAFIVGKFTPFTKEAFGWIKRGDLGRRQIATIAGIVAISGVSLVLWFAMMKPDVSDIAARIPHIHPIALVLTGILFAVSNAACEEFVWRGMIFNALEMIFDSSVIIVLIQALSFGIAHLNGFPRGASGIVLASIYGCMMGYVRQSAKGLLAPVVAHVFADAVIYAILVYVALGR
jgi:membrane protease YdiL (CAAX protease family)